VKKIMNKKLVLVYVIFLFFLFIFIKNCSAYEIINLNIKIENYIKKNNPFLQKKQCELIAKIIIRESSYYNISWKLTLALIEVESNFDPKAISSAGAKGLMQVYTLECFGIKADETKLFEIEYNISFGLCILQDKLRIANNDWIKAITLYNGSGSDARKYTLKVLDTLTKINKELY